MATTQSRDPYEEVNHPRHYNQHPSNVETVEIIEHLPANLSHAFKYIWRCGLKRSAAPPRELKSALWWVDRERKRRVRFATPRDEKAEAVWRELAERIIQGAKTRETHDALAICLGALLRDDLEELSKLIEQELLRAW